jgi:signal transduction histidine kinase/ActR/RegA family two-component response regulator
VPFGKLRLRAILALLVLTTTLPLGLFAALLIARSSHEQREIIERRNVETARAVSVAIDQQVESTRTTLVALAASEFLDQPDRAAFNALAVRLVPTQPGWYAILLVHPSGAVIADTALGPDDKPSFTTADWVGTVLKNKRPTVSNLFQDATTGGSFFVVAVPVVRSGEVRAVLAAQIRSNSLSEILRRQSVPTNGVITVLDANPQVMARTRREAEYLGMPATKDFMDILTRMNEGSWRSATLEGIPTYASFSRSPVTGWSVIIAMSARDIDYPISRSMWQLGLVGLLILGIGVGCALVLSTFIVRALTSAASAARALARGEPVMSVPSRIVESDELSTGLLEAAGILDARIRERDQALLAERVARSASQEARREAEALSRSKDEFVATVSHELRTPLNAIFGWVRLLRSDSLNDAQRAHALEVVERNTRAQAQLIEDLLDMSRIVTGKLRLDMRRVDLGGIVRTAVDSVKPAAQAKELVIALDLDPQVGLVSGDPDRLQQVVWNLLTNSVKFTPRAGRVDVSLRAEGSEVVLQVKDTGIGIPRDLLPHVFERFRQGASSASRTHGGLGIGLALVRHLAELHGGTAAAESEGEGHGATFTVRLPMLPARAAPEQALLALPERPADAESSALGGLSVLVVDDDPDARDLISTTLLHAGAKIISASSAHEAIERLNTTAPDVVVSDIAMPDGTGYDVVRHLRSIAHLARVPAIALTAYGRPEDRERALTAGFNLHIVKPVEPQHLVHAIAAAVGRA